MIKDIELIKHCDPVLENKIVLYGGGYYGKKAVEMLHKLGLSIEAICTTTVEKNPLIEDVRYITVSELKELDDRENLLIVISTTTGEFIEQIVEALDRYKIVRGRRVTYLGLRYACLLNKKIDKTGRMACEWNLWYMWYEDFMRSMIYKRWWEGLSQDGTCWVYTAGKVGSTTVCKSLEENGIPNVLLHEMNQEEAKYRGALYLDGRTNIPGRCFEEYDLFLEHLKEQEHVRIITMVREPVARDISRFFQCFYMDYTTWRDQTNDLYSDFLKMTEGFLTYKNEFNWFNQEIKKVFGIDIYSYPFDKENGYAIIQEKNISILVLKLEKMNVLASIIGQFVGLNNFELINGNEHKNKIYRYMYEEFKKHIRLPKRYIDKYYQDNQYMNHFYTEEEKAGFLQKWGSNIADE